jgi:hypothetical protein
MSRLVRKGILSREEAISKLEDQPTLRLKEIMNELSIRDTDLPTFNG